MESYLNNGLYTPELIKLRITNLSNLTQQSKLIQILQKIVAIMQHNKENSVNEVIIFPEGKLAHTHYFLKFPDNTFLSHLVVKDRVTNLMGLNENDLHLHAITIFQWLFSNDKNPRPMVFVKRNKDITDSTVTYHSSMDLQFYIIEQPTLYNIVVNDVLITVSENYLSSLWILFNNGHIEVKPNDQLFPLFHVFSNINLITDNIDVCNLQAIRRSNPSKAVLDMMFSMFITFIKDNQIDRA